MEERAPRQPATAAWLFMLALALAAARPAPGAEIRFAGAVLSVAETTPTVTVELDLTAPECGGQVRVPESFVVVSSAAGGANPGTLGADFAGVEATVPIGVTGVAPIRFGRVIPSLVVDDDDFEGDAPETFLLELTLAAGATVQCPDGSTVPLAPGPPLVVEIVDDEVPAEIALSQASDRVPEARGSASYSLLRSVSTSGRVTATLAASSRRVSIDPAVVAWGDGDGGARDFTVTFGDDDVAQGDERVRLTFTVEGPAVTGQPDRLVITIVDDDRSTVAFTRGEAAVDEAQETATFALRRTGRSGAAQATLRSSSTAVELDPPTVSWGAGETGDRPFTVRFTDDNRDQDDRTVVLSFDLTGNAEPAAPERLRITIVDDDDVSDVAITGGDNQLAAVASDLAQPLVVQVTDQAGEGVEGVGVSWSIVEGDAILVGGAETTTDANGFTSNRVRIGATPGTVRVRAEIAGTGLAEEFTANVLPSDPVGDALIRACRTDDDLNEVCGYFRGLDPAEQQAVIEEIRPEEVASQVNVTQDAPRVQLGNVGARLAALRQAGTRSGVQQLALNVRGLSVNPYALTTALTRRTARELDPVEAVDRAFAAAVAVASTATTTQDEAAPPTGDESIARQGRLGFYVNGSASFGDRPGTALETGFDFSTLGLTAGLDYRLKAGLFVGGALGYLDNDTDLDADGGNLATEGLSLSLYLMRYWEKGLYVQAVAGYGENDHDQVRNIDLTVPFKTKTRYAARGRTDGTQTSLAAELGYDSSRGAWTIGGYGRLSLVETDVDSFRETGDPDGSGFYLEVFDQSTESLLGEGGLNVSYAASYSWGVLLPQGRFSYLHEFEDGARDIRARFIEDVDPTNVFAIPTEEPDRDYFNVGVGLGAQFQRGVSAFLFYDTDVDRADLDVSTVSAGVRFEF